MTSWVTLSDGTLWPSYGLALHIEAAEKLRRKRMVAKAKPAEPDLAGGGNEMAVAAGKLRSFIERVESLEEDKKAIGDDIKEVYAEAKGTGLDTKTIRTLVRWRRKDKAKREAENALLELYSGALGEVGVFG